MTHATPAQAAPPHTVPGRSVVIGLALGVILVVGAVLRGYLAVDLPLWFDEAATWDVAAHQPLAHFATWEHHNTHPPLSYLAVRASMQLFDSDAPWVMRLPSLICGIALIPAVYLLGRVALSPGAGLLAAAVVAVDPNMVDQSAQARMYTMLMLPTVLAMTWLITLLRRPGKGAAHWLGLGALLGVMLWVNFLALVVWAGLVVAAALLVVGGLVIGQRYGTLRLLLRGLAMCYVTAGAVGFMAFYKLATQPAGSGGTTAPPSWRIVIVALKDMLHPHPAALGVYLLVAVGLLLLARRCKTSAAVLVGVAMMNVLGAYFQQAEHHFMDPRYLAAVGPAIWLGLACLVVALAAAPWRAVAGCVLLAYLAGQAWQCTHLRQWRLLPDRYDIAPRIVTVSERRGEGEPVVYHPQVLEVMGRYYGLPADVAIEAALYDGSKLRDTAHLPRTTASATWVIVGMVNYTPRRVLAQRTLAHVAAAHGLDLPQTHLDEMIELARPVALRVTDAGIVRVDDGD